MITIAENAPIEKLSITGFCDFCKNNIPLIIAVSFTLFFTFGIRLFWHSIGIDVELWMADKSDVSEFFISIGRFGLILLHNILYIKEFNPFTEFFTASCLIWFFTISWCYVIAIFSRDTGKNNKLIPFAIVFMTSSIWAEQFLFLFQSTENALIIGLCPYAIYLLFIGILCNEKCKIICAFFLLIFMTSVYQAIVPMFCCGIFICFVLLQEHSDYEPKVYKALCLKLFITLASSILVYSIIDKAIIPAIFHIKKSDYLDNMNLWGKTSINENIRMILISVYRITLKNAISHENILSILQFFGYNTTALKDIHPQNITFPRVASTLLLPISMLFLVQIAIIMRKMIPANGRFLYMLAGIGIPASIMFLSIAGGNSPTIRSYYALPLAMAFMFFFLIMHYKEKWSVIVVFLAMLVAINSAQTTAQLFYSDHIRYNEDVRLAISLNNLVMQVQPDNRMLPVALVGKYKVASRFQTNFLQGEVIGHSFFEWGRNVNETSTRGLAFMKSLGMNFNMPNDNQLQQALKEAESMPSYPNFGCIKRMQDFIVIKISETLYEN